MARYLVILLEPADRGDDPVGQEEEMLDAVRRGGGVVGQQFRMANADGAAVWPVLTAFEIETDDPQAAVESVARRSGAPTAGAVPAHAFLFEAIGERTGPAASLSAGSDVHADGGRDG